jgi:hypothetical protein
MIIDGHNWEANISGTSGFLTNGLAGANPDIIFDPPVDTPEHGTMLRTFRFETDLEFSLTDVPDGNYDVYLWVFANGGYSNATVLVNGRIVLPNYLVGTPGHWDRLGPYPMTVDNGIVQVDYSSDTPGENVLISGVEVWQRPTTTPPTPLSIVSRKTHDDGGVFDVDLSPPASGIECRDGGVTQDHTIVLMFPVPVTIGGDGNVKAQVMSGAGQVGAAGVADGNDVTVDGAQVTVHLTGVANAQRLEVTIFNVSDGTNRGDVSFSMSVLLGDVTGNGTVNSSDVSATKAQSGTVANANNFRLDVTASGLINSSDVSFVKSKSGTALP